MTCPLRRICQRCSMALRSPAAGGMGVGSAWIGLRGDDTWPEWYVLCFAFGMHWTCGTGASSEEGSV